MIAVNDTPLGRPGALLAETECLARGPNKPKNRFAASVDAHATSAERAQFVPGPGKPAESC